MFGLNETRYGTKDLIGWDVNGGVEDITLHNLLVEVGLLDEGHGHEELTVVWEYADKKYPSKRYMIMIQVKCYGDYQKMKHIQKKMML